MKTTRKAPGDGFGMLGNGSKSMFVPAHGGKGAVKNTFFPFFALVGVTSMTEISRMVDGMGGRGRARRTKCRTPVVLRSEGLPPRQVMSQPMTEVEVRLPRIRTTPLISMDVSTASGAALIRRNTVSTGSKNIIEQGRTEA